MAVWTPGSDSNYLQRTSMGGLWSGYAWAFSAWVNLDSTTGSTNYNVGVTFENEGGSSYFDFGHYVPDGDTYVEVISFTSALFYTTTTLDTWYHLYGRLRNNAGVSYTGRRGVTGSYTTDSDTNSYTVPAGITRARVGSTQVSGNPGNWRIQDFMLWVDSAAAGTNLPSVAQLEMLSYSARPVTSIWPTIWWPFRGNDDWNDYSGNGFHLTEVGTTVTSEAGPPNLAGRPRAQAVGNPPPVYRNPVTMGFVLEWAARSSTS